MHIFAVEICAVINFKHELTPTLTSLAHHSSILRYSNLKHVKYFKQEHLQLSILLIAVSVI